MISAFAQIDHTILNPEVTVTIPDSIGTNFYYLDLDNNGTTDFNLEVKLFFTSEFSPRSVKSYSSDISGLVSNKINVGPFLYGEIISDSIEDYNKDLISGWIPEYGGKLGSWPHTLTSSENIAYVGLKLDKNGSTYFGWLKLKTDGKSITIYSYAINTSPNQSITAGQIN